jgi:hypothetical protein
VATSHAAARFLPYPRSHPQTGQKPPGLARLLTSVLRAAMRETERSSTGLHHRDHSCWPQRATGNAHCEGTARRVQRLFHWTQP